MRVSIYKLEDGTMSALIQASPGKRRSPVLIQGVTPEDLPGLVAPAVAELRRPREPKYDQLRS